MTMLSAGRDSLATVIAALPLNKCSRSPNKVCCKRADYVDVVFLTTPQTRSTCTRCVDATPSVVHSSGILGSLRRPSVCNLAM